MTYLKCLFCDSQLIRDDSNVFDYCKNCNIDFWIHNNLCSSVFINIIFNENLFCLSYNFDDKFADLKILKEYNSFKNSKSKKWFTIKTIPIELIKEKNIHQIRDKIKKYIVLL